MSVMLLRQAPYRLATIAALVALMSACQRPANNSGSHTFEGATVRIIVGFSPGGTYDLHARLIATHLGRYLPGEPTVVVENMTGAGGAVAASYLTNVATPDGLTIGLLAETSAVDLVESGLIDRVQLLGSPANTTPVVVFSKRSGIATLDDWRKAGTPPKIASSGPRAVTFVVPRIATVALGLPAQIVSGYSGTAEMRLALEGGEVDAVCVTWDSVKTVFGSPAAINPVLRFSREPVPGLAAPDAMSIADDERARRLLETGIYAMTSLVRFFAAPRGAPATRVALLRAGLTRTWSDPQFLAAAHAAGLEIAPVTADALEQTLHMLAGRREVFPELRSILAKH